jgi:ubiquinone/menaquinone biosynthesis C-methylase UbiE
MSELDGPAGSNEIISHYNRYHESERLKHDLGLIEWERCRELYLRYLPPAPAAVVDIGGANGEYSLWLAELGYQAHLVDLVPRHIEQARAVAALPGAPQLASMTVGDARALDFPDACADAVVMHGPLYHLTERAERIQVLTEAWRILKPGGVLLAVGITRYAGLIYGLTRGLIYDPVFLKMIQTETQTGLRENPPATLFTFPQAFFHHPDELAAEIRDAGLQPQAILGIIGPSWLVPDLDASWQDPAKRESILAVARMTEREPLLGPRLLGVGLKPIPNLAENNREI